MGARIWYRTCKLCSGIPSCCPLPDRLLQAETSSGSHPKAVVMCVHSANPLGKLPRAQSLAVLSPHEGRCSPQGCLRDAQGGWPLAGLALSQPGERLMLISYQTTWWLSSSHFRTAFRHLPARKHVPKHPHRVKSSCSFCSLNLLLWISSTSVCRRVCLGIIWQGPDPCSWCL